MADLTPRQQRFVNEYLIDLHVTNAAKRAGYKARSAKQQGTRLLSKAPIKAAIAAGMDERAERTAIDADWVVKELRENIETAKACEPPQLAVINGALTQLGKHTGGFVERSESTVATSIEVNIRTFDDPAPNTGKTIKHEPSPALGAGEGDNEGANGDDDDT